MRTQRLAIPMTALLTWAALAPGGASAGTNLVTNGGFETGDFTGWTADGWIVTTNFGPISGPNSGTYFAAEACPQGGCADTLSQTLNTTPGDSYNLTFAFNMADLAPNYELLVQWGGQDLETIGGGSGTFWEQQAGPFISNLFASSSSTTLKFTELDGATGIGIDDVSVTSSVPEPTTWAMMGLGFASLAYAGRRTRRCARAVA